jgi:acyl-CoA thioesterase
LIILNAIKMKKAQQILQKMLENDHFTQWLGLTIDEIGEGYCRLHYLVKNEMLNGFNTLHGGVIFSAADSAFAFACNSHGRVSVALDVSITFTKAARVGEVLTVEAKEVYLGNKTSVYDIITRNEKGEIVAIFKGTAYRTEQQV